MSNATRPIEPLSGAHHPRTSLLAAASMRVPAGKQREMIEAYVLSCGEDGATSDEICLALNLGPQSVSPRLLELRGEVKNELLPRCLVAKMMNGKEVTRLTGGGRPARVHVHVVFDGSTGQLNLFQLLELHGV